MLYVRKRVRSHAGMHTFHTFAPEWIDEYKGLKGAEYQAAKERNADEIITRLEAVFPGLRAAIDFKEVTSPVKQTYLSQRVTWA